MTDKEFYDLKVGQTVYVAAIGDKPVREVKVAGTNTKCRIVFPVGGGWIVSEVVFSSREEADAVEPLIR